MSLNRIELTIFTRFPSLPAGIRCHVWDCVAMHPRTTNLFPSDPNGVAFAPGYIRWRVPVPAILHTCLESRQRGLRHYSLSTLKSFFDHNTHVYFNFNADVFTLAPWSSTWCLFWSPEAHWYEFNTWPPRARIQNIEVDVRTEYLVTIPPIEHILHFMPSLLRLCIMVQLSWPLRPN